MNRGDVPNTAFLSWPYYDAKQDGRDWVWQFFSRRQETMPGRIIKSPLLKIICLCLFNTQIQAAEVTIHKNDESGLLTWSSKDDGFSIELIQLIPDFVRAVYSKYGLPADEVERIAGYCVFGSIIQNTSQQQLSYRVSDWRYVDKNGKAYPVKTKAQWLEEWRKAGITFAWTLLPESGDFGIGDWQQGFTTIQFSRNEKFDLVYTWTLEGKKHQGKIENMSCAPANL